MAKAIAHCICPDCGATFERRVDGFNRHDADSRAAWMEQRPGYCVKCYRKHQREKAGKVAAELHLPAIHGVSDKQVAYAEDLRGRFVAEYRSLVEDAVDLRDDADQQAMLAAKAAEAGMETDAFIRANLRKREIVYAQYQAYIVATVGQARELIDTLRGDY